MKNPFFVGRYPEVDASGDQSVADLLARTGGNTGNFLFIDSLRRVVRQEGGSQPVAFRPRQVREQHDGLVIPAANWLNGHSDWGGLATKIEVSALPCVIVGLGAQSQTSESYPRLTAGTERLIRVVAERSHSISVRGQYSAEVLAHYGVKNVTVTGCPSLLWHVDRPARVEKDAAFAPELVSVCGTRANRWQALRSGFHRSEASLLLSREALRRGYDYVAQTEVHDIAFALGRFSGDLERMESLDYLRRVYDESDDARLVRYLESHVKVFFNVPDWLTYLSNRDFVIGTRLHGVIASLLSGVPALLVTHDTRTSEAARQMAIPAVSSHELLCSSMDILRLYQLADIDTFNRRMPGYFSSFAEYFRQNDVETNLAS